MPLFPSDAWFQDFVEVINASERYREVAADWEGDVAFAIEAEPDKGVPLTVYGWLDLWHGACRSGGIVDEPKASGSRYLIRAPFSRWRDLLEGDLDPIRGMMQGKLRVRGDLPTILRYVNAANELVHLTGSVSTSYPEGA
ncbi:MAG: SCP2 sterol-binding domain-containing protein [Actinomycetota bacterium]